MNIDFSTESNLSKSRLIVLTDVPPLDLEPDDVQSLVRLCLYSNEIDIEGIIAQTSVWQKELGQVHIDRINTVVKAYSQVRNNLLVHAASYPTAEYLFDCVKMGQVYWGMADVGDEKNTAGSDLIISVVDKSDTRPVWIAACTGTNTLAQALWDVRKSRTQAEVDFFLSKIRVNDINAQDDAGAWICHNFPDIQYYRHLGYGFCGFSQWDNNVGDHSVVSKDWVANNIQNHGPLGDVYPTTTFGLETDTPSFINLVKNGLTDPEHPEWGGWGGRFTKEKQLNPPGNPGVPPDGIKVDQTPYLPFYAYTSDNDTWYWEEGDITYQNNEYTPYARWRNDFQNDMAIRMDWSINSNYNSANHNPIPIVNGNTTKDAIFLKSSPGGTVTLDAFASYDPDGDNLTFKWFYYSEAGSYPGKLITIDNYSSAICTVHIPSDFKDGQEIHIVLRVTDNGIGFPACSYRRVIISCFSNLYIKS